MIIAGVQCPTCSGVDVIRQTPLYSGPIGWGYVRCKACGLVFREWPIEDREDEQNEDDEPESEGD